MGNYHRINVCLTEDPNKWPPSSDLDSILLSASTTKTKRSGDSRSPCWKPLVRAKKPLKVPFTNTKNRTEDIQEYIHFNHCSPNPHLLYIRRKYQFTWSHAFPNSIFQSTLRTFSWSLQCKYSFAIKTESRIQNSTILNQLSSYESMKLNMCQIFLGCKSM